MITKKDVLAEIENLFGLKELVKTYEEIAASRMQRIRSMVLADRSFLDGLLAIYHEVVSSYKDELLLLMQRRKIKDPARERTESLRSRLSIMKRNGRTVCVFVSANIGLYGDIIRKTFDLFLEHVRQIDCDVVVIGRRGQRLLQAEKIARHVTFFEFPDQGIDPELVRKIAKHLVAYETVLVFHGKFENIISQIAVASNISGNWPGKNIVATPQVRYIFEPSLEKIIRFFETELFTTLFEQSLQESQLAKFASRMVNLDQATENVENRLKAMQLEKRKLQRRAGDKKQLAAYSSMGLWGSR